MNPVLHLVRVLESRQHGYRSGAKILDAVWWMSMVRWLSEEVGS